ncbi:MAG: DUF1800 domain-containing protein [Candidatus Promineifilaceae bacterium]|nr:DUF1800 domain-containing protein [Candidatus Promineifilaceae bacterium]
MKQAAVGSQHQQSTNALPSVGVIALNRMGFGPRPGDLGAFYDLGSTAEERLSNYVEQQLHPQDINDSELDGRVTAAGFETLNKSLVQSWQDHIVNNTQGYSYRILPYRETERLTFFRAVYSRRQLVQVLADFWHNHFNVYGLDYYVAPVFMHYDREIIRKHLLGNFREMLEAVTKSTPMLTYLDNYTNSDDGPNENFSRELFELQTMGAKNYLGVISQEDVPGYPGQPIGYVDDDVYEAARCFTGWTIRNSSSDPVIGNTGEFYYRSDWHDRFQKHILGTKVDADQADLVDGQQVLDLLTDHPGTASHIAEKLCRRFISDNPPQSIVDSTAELFYAQRHSPSQLKKVMRHLLNSVEFRTTWGAKTKRPFEVIVSACRACAIDFTFSVSDGDSSTFFWLYDQIGQPLFGRRPPDGYPDKKENWLNTSTMVSRWQLLNWLITVEDDLGNLRIDVVGQTPANVRSSIALVDFWLNRILGRSIDPAERQHLIDFMAQGHNPNLDLPLDSDENIQTRLGSMVGLILLSPEFQWR